MIYNPSGKILNDLYYISMEYYPAGILYNVVESLGGLGEADGRFFMQQMI
jgi:hypothetical protein